MSCTDTRDHKHSCMRKIILITLPHICFLHQRQHRDSRCVLTGSNKAFIELRLDELHRYWRSQTLMHEKNHPDHPASYLLPKYSILHQRQHRDSRCVLIGSNKACKVLGTAELGARDDCSYSSGVEQ